MEQYIVNGRVENVRPEDVERFMQAYPNARKANTSNVEPTSSGFGGYFDWQNVVGSTVKKTNKWGWDKLGELVEPYKKVKSGYDYADKTLNTISRIGGEYADALKTGAITGSVLEEYLEVFNGNHSPEAVDAMVVAGNKLNKLPPNDRMIKFAEAVDEAGGGFFNGLIELGKDPDGGFLLASQVAVQSLAMMVAGGADSIGDAIQGKTPDALAWMAAGAGTGALTFGGISAAAGSFGGPIGTAIGGFLGAGTGTLVGAMGGLSTALENGLTYVELLQEEMRDANLEYTRENIAKFLSDDNNHKRIRSKALKRGLTIGATDMIGGGISASVGIRTAKAFGKSVNVAGKTLKSTTTKGMLIGTGVSTAVEGVSGGVGEFLGQKAAGQEYNAADIILETFAETPGAIVTGPTKGLISSIKKPTYSITENGKKITYTQDQFLQKIDGLDGEDIAMLDIDIKGDKMLAGELFEIQNDFIIRSQIDPNVPDGPEKDRLVELEKERRKQERASKAKFNKVKQTFAKNRLKVIEEEIGNIVEKYQYRQFDPSARAEIKEKQQIKKKVGKAQFDIMLNQLNTKLAKQGKKQLSDVKQLAKYVEEKTGKVFNIQSGNSKDFEKWMISNRVDEQTYREGLKNMYNSVLEDPNSTTEEKNEASIMLEQIESQGFLEEIPMMAKGDSKQFGQMNPTFDEKGNVSYDIFINEETAFTANGDLNVAAHEFFHGAIFSTLKGNIQAQMTVGNALMRALKAGDVKLKPGSQLNELINQYKENEGLGEEILTQVSSAMQRGELVFNEGFVQKLRDIWRQFGQKYFGKEIRFDTDQDVLNFVKDFNKTVNNPSKINKAFFTAIEKGIQGKLLEGIDIEGGPKVGSAPMSKQASDKVQNIYNEKGVGGAFEIMQEFKPITTKAARKYRDVPGYEESLLIDEIETGKRGIFDLIREYKPDSGVPLAAYINKFLPARAIEAAKRILKTEFTEDVTERVDIAAEEVTPEVKTKRKPKKIVLADRLGIKDKVYRSIDKILSDLNLNELTFKTLKNQIPEITGKLFGIDPKKIVNKANITKSELQSSQMFISKNADLLISMLPEGATASGTATGVPKSLLQAFYTKTGRAKMAKTGTKAGLAIQQKRKINRKEFLETFGIIDGKPVRTDRNTSARVLALADTLGKMITNQAVRQRAEGLTIEAVNRLKDGKSGVMFSKNNVKEITSDVNKKNPQFFKLANVPDVNGKPQQQLPKGPVLIQKINEKGEVTFTEGSIKLMDSLWDVDQGITWGQHMSNRINNFLDSHPEYYNILQELLTGGVKRTAYMTVDNFQALIPKTEKIKKADQIVNERLDYHRTLTTKEKEAGLKGKRLRKNIETLDRSKDKNKLNNLIKFFQDMSNYLNKDNGKNMTDLWLMDELLKHSSVDQNNFFRKSAQLLGFPVDDNGNPITNQIVVEEHTPINEVIKIAMGSAIRGKVKNIKPLLESLLSQISILDVDDPSGSLKASLGKDFYSEVLPRIVNGDLKLKPGHAGIYRLMKHGVNPFRYKLLESGNTIAQEFGVDNLNIDDARQRIIDYFEGKVSLEYNKAMSKVPFARDSTSNYRLSNAISSGRNPSFSMSSKGITVLDFDDTLATTKSGVRARIPNPDGTPKPKRKAVLLAGGAGSGKSNVVKQLGLEEQGFKIVNQDISLEWLKKNNGLPTDMKDLTKEQMSMLGKLGYQARMIAKRKYGKFKGQGDGVIIDGTGGSVKTIQTQKTELEAAGYDVQMLFVETSLEVAQERNKNRKERSLSSSIVRRNHEAVQKNKPEFKKIFGEGFTEVNTDNLKQNDPMPKSVSKKISNFVTSYEKRRLDAEEFALEGADILEKGGEFDFSEFNKVVEGKIAPLFQKALKLQKKFGNKDMFVLTARPAESQQAIFEFLKANGLNIPLENITGLANSTPEAKALWMADKVADGYNDFYFADDALQNVQAVKNILDQFDVKSKVQQAKAMFSKNLDKNFNDILEEVTGIDSKKRFSDIKARKRGESKGKFRFFIPPSHEDFVGLLYNFMGKGRKGDAHRDFFEQALVRPLNRAYREIDAAKQAVANDYKSLNKQFPEIKKKLTKKTPDGDFTYQDAIRVYLWDKHGYDIPGLSPTDRKNLVNLVNNDSNLKAYSDALNILSKQEAYVDPGPNWETGNIRIDLVDATGRVGRASYFTEFNENADIIFSPENLNKIEAAYGKAVKEALEDMLHRIKTGINRPKGASAKPNMFMNWLNASVSGVMFFNTRSALLQQMSNVNYLNFADNNIFAAGKAFANQKQYWNDFAMIFNSDMLKQRRGGLQTDINGAELAEAIKKARPGNIFDQVAIITGKALRLGFLPTQIGDNIAIATGGAAFYRNRVNKYIKDGLSEKEAESKAWIDFSNITQTTQQSALPHMTSQQQAMWIGKLVLNFLNTPSQYNRIIKKSGSDIINRRITPPNTTQMQSDMSNMSRILYYGAAQNLIFYSLQTALFAVMFGLGDEDEEKNAEQILKKKERVINGAIDTILRGSGIYGVAVSTLKNMMIKFLEQREKGYNKDESAVIMEALNFSPVVGIKARKIVNAEKTLNYNKKIIDEMETFDIDNPMWSAVTNYIEVAGPPANRIYQKTINLRNASDNQYTAFQRAMFLSGYTTWSLGLGDTQKMKDVKEKIKKEKKKTKKSPFKPRFKPKY